jgi:hypothetical protein
VTDDCLSDLRRSWLLEPAPAPQGPPGAPADLLFGCVQAEGMARKEQDMSRSIYYLLACRECGDGEDATVLPFASAADRGKWATAHTRETGHDRWYVKDEER